MHLFFNEKLIKKLLPAFFLHRGNIYILCKLFFQNFLPAFFFCAGKTFIFYKIYFFQNFLPAFFLARKTFIFLVIILKVFCRRKYCAGKGCAGNHYSLIIFIWFFIIFLYIHYCIITTSNLYRMKLLFYYI